MTPPIQSGSLSLWMRYMADELATRGHKITVFGNNGRRLAARHRTHGDVEYVLTPTLLDAQINRLGSAAMRLKAMLGAPTALGSAVWAGWLHAGYAREAAKRAHEIAADIVHIMNYSQFVPIVRKHSPHSKISLHMQCEWLTQFPRDEIERRLEATDVVVGCSEYITRTIQEAFPTFAHKCVTVPNSAHIVSDEDAAVPVGRNVLFVGRLSPEKGIHDLILAFHRVLEKVPDARLHLVGGAGAAPLEYLVGLSNVPYVVALQRFYETPLPPSGKDRYFAELEQMAGRERGNRIVFEGQASHEDILSHYRKASVLVNPSLSESFGISLVEAMMMKIPVVATRVGGMSYTVVHGETGFLVDPANPDGLADSICRILTDANLAERMGMAGRERARQHFSWESSANKLIAAFESTLV